LIQKIFKILKEKYLRLKIGPEKIFQTKETIIICVTNFQELIKEIIERRKRGR
jgi:hypothetical protein